MLPASVAFQWLVFSTASGLISADVLLSGVSPRDFFPNEAIIFSGVFSPKIWGVAKIFNFRRITLSC